MFNSKSASYAVMAATEVARARANGNKAMHAETIASTFGLPAAYAAKILTQLARAGLLESARGPQGGYCLARAPDAITLLELVEAVGAVHPIEVAETAPDRLRELIREALGRARDEARERLRTVTLSDLLAGASEARGSGPDVPGDGAAP